MDKSGRFITFEGPEGCGKSTQIKRLAECLQEKGILALCTREPGGTATGEAIRNILQHNAAGEDLCGRSELLLFTASRAQLMDHVVSPALERGEWVLCDRFIDSTMAYQGFARGMPVDTLDKINLFAINDRKPDLTLLLDLDIKTAFQRLDSRFSENNESADRFELEGKTFHEKVRSGYHQLANREPNRFHIVDASLSVDDVTERVWDAVKDRFF